MFFILNDFSCDFMFIMVMAVDMLKATAVDKIPSDLEGMEASMQHLLVLIDDIYKYVDDVVVRYCCLL